MVQFQAQVITTERRSNHDSLVINMSISKVELSFFRAASDREVVVEGMTYTTKHLILPIISRCRSIKVTIFPITKQIGIFALIVSQHRILTLPLNIVSCRKSIQSLSHLLPRIVCVVRYTYLTLLTTLSSNEDYTVGTTRTVDSCRRSILQYCDIFDIGSRNIADTFHWETIDDIKRCIVASDRATTTYTNLHLRIRRTFGSGDLHTSHLTLQCLSGIGHRNSFKSLVANCSYRTCQVLFLDCTITDDNDVVQTVGVIFELDIDG